MKMKVAAGLVALTLWGVSGGGPARLMAVETSDNPAAPAEGSADPSTPPTTPETPAGGGTDDSGGSGGTAGTSVNVVGDPASQTSGFNFGKEVLIDYGDKNSAVQSHFSNFGILNSLLARYLLIGTGLMFFVLILVSGYRMVFAGDKPGAVAKAKRQLTIGVAGLLVVFFAYWIALALLNLIGLNLNFDTYRIEGFREDGS